MLFMSGTSARFVPATTNHGLHGLQNFSFFGVNMLIMSCLTKNDVNHKFGVFDPSGNSYTMLSSILIYNSMPSFISSTYTNSSAVCERAESPGPTFNDGISSSDWSDVVGEP